MNSRHNINKARISRLEHKGECSACVHFFDWWTYFKIIPSSKDSGWDRGRKCTNRGSKGEEITVVVPTKPYQSVTLRYLAYLKAALETTLTEQAITILAFKSAATLQ